MHRLLLLSICPLALVVLLSAGAQEPEVTEAAGDAMSGVVPLISRWLHVLGAIFLLGGALYLRLILMPAAAESLDDTANQKLRAGVRARWSKVLGILILVLLVTGLFNYLAVTRFAHDNQPAYHMLFGIKFLLALAVFGLASIVAGRRALAMKLQQNGGFWLGVNIALGIVIVLIAGYMKMM